VAAAARQLRRQEFVVAAAAARQRRQGFVAAVAGQRQRQSFVVFVGAAAAAEIEISSGGGKVLVRFCGGSSRRLAAAGFCGGLWRRQRFFFRVSAARGKRPALIPC
jgi:hypothetical protein